MDTRLIFHMCQTAEWHHAREIGRYDGSSQDRADGFIHFSTAGQIRESARRHRAGQSDLLLIAVDAGALGDRLRWEASRGGALFPHLYGPLDPAEALWTVALALDATGRHIFPDAIPERPAGPVD